MRYTVVYDPSAEAQLIDIWMQAPNRRAVRNASNEIDRQLKQSPDRSGYSFGPHRRLMVYPLAVEYTVSPPDRMVRVIRVEFLP
jgi:hypothetical protein